MGVAAAEAHRRCGALGSSQCRKINLACRRFRRQTKNCRLSFHNLASAIGRGESGGKQFCAADIPGLIEGANEGHGLGTRFLGHVERCAILLHLVDVTGDDPVKAYRVIRKELKEYGPELEGKPEIIAFNKIDAISDKDLQKKLADFKKRLKKTPILISGATHKNVDDTMKRLLTIIQADRNAARKQEERGIEIEDWHP